MKTILFTVLLFVLYGTGFSATWQFEGAAVQDLGRLDRQSLFDTWLPIELEDGTVPKVQGIFVSYQHEGLLYYFGPFLDKAQAEEARARLDQLRARLIKVDPKFRTSTVSTVETQPGSEAPQNGSLPPEPPSPMDSEQGPESSSPNTPSAGESPPEDRQLPDASSLPDNAEEQSGAPGSEPSSPAEDSAGETASDSGQEGEPSEDSSDPAQAANGRNGSETSDQPNEKDAPASSPREEPAPAESGEPSSEPPPSETGETTSEEDSSETGEVAPEASPAPPTPTPEPKMTETPPEPVDIPPSDEQQSAQPTPSLETPATTADERPIQKRNTGSFYLAAALVAAAMTALYAFLTRDN